VKGIASGRGVRVEAGSESLISSAGGSMLLKTAAASGLAAALSRVLASRRAPRSVLAAAPSSHAQNRSVPN